MFERLQSLFDAARRALRPTFMEQLSPLERQIACVFAEHNTGTAAGVLIYRRTDESGDRFEGFDIPHGVNPRYYQPALDRAPNVAYALVAALKTGVDFEHQWSLKPGLLEDIGVLTRYPMIRVPELERKLPPAVPAR